MPEILIDYLLFVGDNSVGKTNRLTVFQQLEYRPLCDVSITPANIYRFLGNLEDGQGIILEDEIDNIDQQDEDIQIRIHNRQKSYKE